jgi:hypothetical protein
LDQPSLILHYILPLLVLWNRCVPSLSAGHLADAHQFVPFGRAHILVHHRAPVDGLRQDACLRVYSGGGRERGGRERETGREREWRSERYGGRREEGRRKEEVMQGGRESGRAGGREGDLGGRKQSKGEEGKSTREE